jgi:hypothetical protein
MQFDLRSTVIVEIKKVPIATFSACCLDFRFDDASYYYWILSMQDLDSAKTAADPREVHHSTYTVFPKSSCKVVYTNVPNPVDP